MNYREKILNLFFNPGETICVSPNKYGYHSIQQEEFKDDIKLISPTEGFDIATNENQIEMLCLNPVNGFRKDENVTAFRSFLIEIDDGPLADQKEYVEQTDMPYSICVYSGNKSLHYGIVLDGDLINDFVWRFYAEWILKIMIRADQATKNPTRCIRFPGTIRKDTGRPQSLVHLGHRIDVNRLNIWLSKHPDKKPIIDIKPTIVPGSVPSIHRIPSWMQNKLENGVDHNRNETWHSMALVLARNGFTFEESLELFGKFFTPENDFKKSEWRTAIKSAFKYITERHRYE